METLDSKKYILQFGLNLIRSLTGPSFCYFAIFLLLHYMRKLMFLQGWQICELLFTHGTRVFVLTVIIMSSHMGFQV